MQTFELPYPPSVNDYWGYARGRVYPKPAGRSYRAEVLDALVIQEVEPMGARPVALEIAAYPPDGRTRDLDNLLKATLDSIEQARIFDDDGQVESVWIYRAEPVPPGKLVIRIMEGSAGGA